MQPQIFSLCQNVILRSEPQYYGAYSAFDYREVRTQSLTGAECKALEYISAKQATAEEIAKASSMKPKDCEKFLQKMTNEGYVEINTNQLSVQHKRAQVDSEFYKRFPIPFLSAPSSVDFFITSRCNLKCAHCFEDKNKQRADMTLQDVGKVLDQLEAMGVLEVRITGGEPLLHPQITEILHMLRQKRIRKVLLTNGTLLSEELAISLKTNGVTPTVSLDDSVPEMHDQFRGVEGSHSRTLEAFKLLQKYGVEFGINCCLNKKSIDHYEEIIDIAVSYGAQRITFLDLKPIGQLRSNPQWKPSKKEYNEIFRKLLLAKAKYTLKIDVALDVFLHCYPMQESIALAKKGIVSCKAGISRLSIASDGTVYPCNYVLADQNWVMGNIKNASLQNIWFSDKWMFFRGQTNLGSLKDCQGCKNRKGCRDFYCRLLPYAVNGDKYSAHPNCQV